MNENLNDDLTTLNSFGTASEISISKNEIRIQELQSELRHLKSQSENDKQLFDIELEKSKRMITQLEEQLKNDKNSDMIQELQNKLQCSEQTRLKLKEKELISSREKNNFLARKSVFLDMVPMDKYNELKQELEKSKQENLEILSKMKETVIETVVEKEKIIWELQQKIEINSYPEKYIDSLLERINLKEQENNKISELLFEKEQNLEDTISERITIKLEEISDSKSKEFDKLFSCIQEQDEKITKYEEQIKILSKNEEKLKHKQETSLEFEKNKIESLIKEKAILTETIKNIQNRINTNEKDSINKNSNIIEEKVDPKILSLQNEKEDLVKKVVSLELEQKKATKTISGLKSKVAGVSKKNLELEEKLDKQMQEFNHNLKLLQKTPKARLSHFNFPNKTSNNNNDIQINISENKNKNENLNHNQMSSPKESLFDSNLQKEFFDFFEDNNKKDKKKAKISICFQEEGEFFKFEVPPTPITQNKNIFEENQIPAKIHEEDEITNFDDPTYPINKNKANEKYKDELDRNKPNEKNKTNNEDTPLTTNEDIMNLSLQTDIKNEMAALLKENDELKIVNKELTELNEKFLKEIEEYDSKENQLMSELQKIRGELITMQNDKINNENRWEDRISVLKAGFLEEKQNLENELRLTEKKAMDAKIMFADLISERDYFELEYRRLLKTNDGEGNLGKKDKKKKMKSIFDVFVCN